MNGSEWLSAWMGGTLIAFSASLVLLFHGRIAGISGIFSAVISPGHGERRWQLFFVLGLLAGGVLLAASAPQTLAYVSDRPTWVLGVAGLLVGFGTRLGNGCTSGHGVCGIPRLSVRSLVAVMTFMTTGVLTAVLGAAVWGTSFGG